MKADVYTGFLTHKVKAYSVDKNVKPKVLSGRVIRKAIPFLVASVMAVPVSCQSRRDKESLLKDHKIEYAEGHFSMIDDLMQEKEFLSSKAIAEIMEHPSPALLNDVNFNHLPENQTNFWEIVRNGVAKTNAIMKSTRLTDEQKAEYKITARKMLAQINHAKGNPDNVDLYDYNNLKTFLYFEKVVRYGDNYSKVLGSSVGMIDERAEVFGRYYQDQEALKQKVSANEGVQKFAKALYVCDERFVLNYTDSIQANPKSREVLKDWLATQGVSDSNLWYFADVDEYDYCNTLAVYSSRGNPLRAVLGVDPKGDLGEGFYSPVGSIIIHELQHLMQKKPASKEKPEDNQKDDADVKTTKSHYDDYTMELGPTLYSLVIEDKMYKEIHSISADKVVDYGDINLGTHKVSIGQTAVWFGKMLEKYPHKSVDKVLSEPEVLNHLNALGNKAPSLYQLNSNGR